MLRSPWRAMLRRSGLALIALLAVSRSVAAPGQSRAASASLPNQALAAMTNLDQDFYDPHVCASVLKQGNKARQRREVDINGSRYPSRNDPLPCHRRTILRTVHPQASRSCPVPHVDAHQAPKDSG